jgi:hypothetical protein
VQRDHAEEIAEQLEALATESSFSAPPYGDPRVLADLLRAYRTFTGRGCMFANPPREPAPANAQGRAALRRVYDAPFDFFISYHIPLLSTWQVCEAAALDRSLGDDATARARLSDVASRSASRFWISRALGSR